MSTLNRTAGAYDRNAEIARINADWADNARWQHAARSHSADDVVRLRGSMKRDNLLARRGAEKLWETLNTCAGGIAAPEAATAADAVRQAQTGAQAITVSGQPIAAVRHINQAFARADQLQWKAIKQPGSGDYIDYFAPIVADAEAGAGVLNAYELAQNLIRAGAAGVHFADQIADRTGETVLLSAQDAVQQLIAARLAADVEDVPTLIVARTHAGTAELLLADCADCDRPFVTGERDEDGFYRLNGGLELAIARGLTYAPHADLLWLETAQPDLAEAQQFAQAIRRAYPDQRLAYSCTADSTNPAFQRELAALGYTVQFGAAERDRAAIDSRAA